MVIAYLKQSELHTFLEEVAVKHAISRGSNVHLSVNLVSVGRALRLASPEIPYLVNLMLNFFRDRIGGKGNLLISSFSFDFTNSGFFSVLNSPIETGSFAKITAELLPSSRTLGPVYSFLAFGEFAKTIQGPFLSSTGQESVFQKITEQGFTLVTIGHHLASAFTIAHHFEESVGVSYRSHKHFSGVVTGYDGVPKPWNTTMYVRATGCEFSGLTIEGFRNLSDQGLTSFSIESLPGGRVASFSCKLTPTGQIIEGDLRQGGSKYVAPIFDGTLLENGITPIDQKTASTEYLRIIRQKS